MNLKEARERSMLAKSFTATKLYCVASETTINISSEFGCIIELKGVIERHREWNREPWEDDDDMPLRNIEFSCEVTSEEPDASTDNEGDDIVAQVLYRPSDEDYAASVKISIWEKNNTFIHLQEMAKKYLSNPNMGIAINLSTNISFRELIEAEDISETWLPINAWNFYFYNKQKLNIKNA